MSRIARASLILLLAACTRAAKPTHGGPLEAEAGLPITFGVPEGPALQWDFGDGTPKVEGASPTHAFATAGTYLVQGLRRGTVFERVEVGVHPRPVLRAVPAQSEWVLFVPRTRGTLEPAVDFLERALSGFASGLAEKQPFARYALELSAGPPPQDLGLDPEEGLAAFMLPEPPVVVAAVGVADEARALAFARLHVAQPELKILRSNERSFLLEDAEKGEQLLVFSDRGYLYLARLDLPLAMADGAARLERAIGAASPEGVAADATLRALRDQVSEGQAYLYLPEVSKEPARAGLAAFRFSPEQLDVDGVVHQGAPLWPAGRAATLPLLARAPEGPLAAVTVSVPPEELARVLLSADALAAGEKAAVEDLARILTGDGWLAAWLDAGKTAERMAAKEGQPDVAGTVMAELGIRDRKAATLLVDELLQRGDLRYTIRTVGGAARFEVAHEAWEGRIDVRDDRVVLRLGVDPTGRRTVALADSLRARSFPGAFGQGHLSILIDLGQLLRDLEAPQGGGGPGGPGGQEALMRGFLSAFLSQASAVDTVTVDVSPSPEGARLRARVTLR